MRQEKIKLKRLERLLMDVVKMDATEYKEYSAEEVILENNQLICALTKKIKTANEKSSLCSL